MTVFPSGFSVYELFLLLALASGNERGDLLSLIEPDLGLTILEERTDTASLVRLALGEPNEERTEPDTVALHVERLGSPSRALRAEAVEELVRIGEAVIPALNETVRNDAGRAELARTVIARIRRKEPASAARRLLAIRLLGQRRDATALAALRGLVRDADPFVRLDAERAVASIEGRPPPPDATAQPVPAIVQALPADTRILFGSHRRVAGTTSPLTNVLDVSRHMDVSVSSREAELRLAAQVVHFVERAGNMQIDGAFASVSGRFAAYQANITVAFRAVYDRDRMIDFLRSGLGGDLTRRSVYDVPVFSEGQTVEIAFVDDRTILMARGTVAAGTRIPEVLAAFLGDGEGLRSSAEIQEFLATVTPESGPWGIAIGVQDLLSEIREANETPGFLSFLGGLERITVRSQFAQGIDVALRGEFEMETSAAALAALLSTQFEGVKERLERLAAEQPTAAPAARALESLEVSAEGKDLVIRAHIEDQVALWSLYRSLGEAETRYVDEPPISPPQRSEGPPPDSPPRRGEGPPPDPGPQTKERGPDFRP